jgi:hypothetical protein
MLDHLCQQIEQHEHQRLNPESTTAQESRKGDEGGASLAKLNEEASTENPNMPNDNVKQTSTTYL